VAVGPGSIERVRVVSLGGTIAMTRQPGGSGGVAPRLTGEDLVAAVPGLADQVAIVTEDFRRLPSPALGVDDIAELAAHLNATADSRTGTVITQGTDTLEETAYLLDLLYTAEAPLVLTGAMRNPSLPGADGPANVFDAVRAAADPALAGLGPVVAFGGELHAARFVRKAHATSITAFASPNAGPIGHVTEGRPRVHTPPPRTRPVALPFTRPASVELITTTLGGEGVILDAVAGHVDGLVIAAFGGGHAPETWVGRLEALAARVPVVLASRTGAGSILTGTYAFPGSESDLLARGLIGAGTLDPYKSRLLLLALLRTGANRTAIDEAFAAYR